PAFEWVHVQLHQQKGMISLSPPTICNSAVFFIVFSCGVVGHRKTLAFVARENIQLFVKIPAGEND
ncbi:MULTISPECIES: hypothetical protein, partial [Enterobacteriaceae]